MIAVGVDGCRGGWIAVAYDDVAATFTPRFFPTFAAIADACPAYPAPTVIAVDIPVGLPTDGPRRCDQIVRRALDQRGASVFPAPHPALLGIATYQEALARARQITGKGISKQLFYILDKIGEVDALVATDQRQRIVEVHPEWSFAMLAGHPMEHAKRHAAGYNERRVHLEAETGCMLPARSDVRRLVPQAKPDDLLDAAVAAWSARRWARGEASTAPDPSTEPPQLDDRGNRIQIIA